jgi:Domain of unknown function (DUF3471)
MKDAANKVAAASKTANNETTKLNENPSLNLSVYAGIYKADAYGIITINAAKDRLIGTFNQWKLKIEHLHNNYFKFSVADNDVFDGTEAIKGQFMIDPRGNIESLLMPFENGIKDIEFKKEFTALTKTKDELSKYIGTYEFAGMTVKVYLSQNNGLKALVPGQPEYDLVYVKEDEFNIKGVKGVSLKFDKDDKGNITACNFNQPNGTFKAKKVDGNKIDLKKESNPVLNEKEVFQKYVGDYNLGGQIVKVFVKENELMALIPGQPEYTLVNVKEYEFAVKGVNGYSVLFDKISNGSISGFTLVQPGGKMNAKKIVQ